MVESTAASTVITMAGVKVASSVESLVAYLVASKVDQWTVLMVMMTVGQMAARMADGLARLKAENSAES